MPSAQNALFPPPAAAVSPDARPTRELLKWLPQFSTAERDRRWALIRERMAEADLEALVVIGTDIFWGMGTANMQYLFHIEAQPACEGLFLAEGEPVVWMGASQTSRPFNRALSTQEWCHDVRIRAGIASIVSEIRARGLERARIGLVGYRSAIQTTPVLLRGDYATYEQLLPDAQIVDASELVEVARRIKSDEEIEMLRAAAAVARQTMQTMIDTARPGLTEAALYSEMARTHIAAGGEPLLCIFLSSGPVEHPRDEVWNLLHGAEGPKAPTMRPLAEGDIVIAEWHTKVGGYRCHTEWTVYLGKKAPDELLRIWDVSQECLEASRAALRAGNTVRDAWTEIRRPAALAGLDFVELGFHGMGTGSPEVPTVIYEEGYGPPALNGHGLADFVLEEGMTFGNNIDLHDSTWKPDVGCMLADHMVVRPGRAESLVDLPAELSQVT